MRGIRWVAIGLFVLGLALLGAAVARGEATVYLVLIVPVIQATGPLAVGAIAAVFGGILLFFASLMTSPFAAPTPPSPPPAAPPSETTLQEAPLARSRRAGGVIFLGPLPIIFGSDTQVARWMVLLAMILFVLLAAFWIAVALL